MSRGDAYDNEAEADCLEGGALAELRISLAQPVMSTNSCKNYLIFILALAVSCAAKVSAQGPVIPTQSKGRIVGRIIDEMTGEAIERANVRIEGTYTGAVSDRSGYYTITGIPPGLYALSVSALEHDTFVQDSVSVLANQTDTINISLRIQCESYADSARSDIQHGKVQLRLGGLIVSLPDSVERPLLRKYGFEYLFTGVLYYCDGPYNDVVEEYLEKRNGKNWRERFDAEYKILREKYRSKDE